MSDPEKPEGKGKFFTVRSAGVEPGEYWVAKVPADAEHGETLQFTPDDAIIHGNGSLATDLISVGIVKSEVDQGHNVGLLINETDEEPNFPDIDTGDEDEGDQA